jgi:SAM-dependent methyltransferase
VKPPYDPNAATIEEFVRQTGAALAPGSRLLDAGAGDSPYRKYFPQVSYVAVDFAATKYHQFDSIDAVCSLQALPFIDQSFDAVLCTEVLEHVPEPEKVLREFNRVIKPGGRVFITVPQSWEVHEAPYDYFRYTSFGLRSLLTRSGFDIVSVQPRGGFFMMLAQRMRHVPLYFTTVPVMRTGLGRRALRIVFMRMLVRLLTSLDSIDKLKIDTIGYACVAVKPAGAP